MDVALQAGVRAKDEPRKSLKGHLPERVSTHSQRREHSQRPSESSTSSDHFRRFSISSEQSNDELRRNCSSRSQRTGATLVDLAGAPEEQ